MKDPLLVTMSNDRPTQPPPVTAYEDLEGAQGREVFFRPMRYRPADLTPVRAVVELSVQDTPYVCDLQDVSQNGLAFLWPHRAPPPPLESFLPVLCLRFDGHTAYRGGAKIISVREGGDVVVVGASFSDALLDIEDVLHLRDVRNWETGQAQELTLRHKPWHLTGHTQFKALISEFRLLLEEAAIELAKVEASLPWQVVHGEGEPPARTALIKTLRATVVEDCLRFTAEADALLRGVNRQDWQSLKEFSQRQLDALLLKAPFLLRARTKPLGYPGDFEVMRYIYEKQFEGPTLFAKTLHLYASMTPGSQFIRSRKDMLKARLRALAKSNAEGRVLRVASIAAGPAQEIYELLTELDEFPGRMEIVLYDQDPRALSLAFTRLTRIVDTRWARQVRIWFLHDSIKRLLRDPDLLRDHAPFDIVMCAGLFDYLNDQKAQVLTRSLYNSLSEGGTVYIGNVVPELPTRWLIEQHLEWYVQYRTRDEIRAFARAGVPEARVEVVEESTGYNPFVTLTRE